MILAFKLFVKWMRKSDIYSQSVFIKFVENRTKFWGHKMKNSCAHIWTKGNKHA